MGQDGNDRSTRDGIRAPWSKSDRVVPQRIVQPVQRFIHTEGSGGSAVIAAAVIALVWANIDFAHYERIWHTNFTIQVGGWEISEDIRHWINEAAMALFFFVVGLEIKRELVEGELRDMRAAALPAIAALGGMIFPAAAYIAITAGSQGARGWGIPMATDIAFAIGVLAIVARGLPPGIRVFLLTLAIVDDIGAIVVIAAFYSSSISFEALAIAVGILGLMMAMRRVNIRNGGVYLIASVAVWIAVAESGIHATIAGVALAFITPAIPFQRPGAVSDEARRTADRTEDDPDPTKSDANDWLRLSSLTRETVSPLTRLENALHPWTSFLVIPFFALANAGVRLKTDGLGDPSSRLVILGIVAGLVVGKILGISLGALIAVRTGIARLPSGVTWSQIIGVAAVGGIGFTVSLFIADLAFDEPLLLDAAKIGILGASVVAGVIGSVILLRARRSEG